MKKSRNCHHHHRVHRSARTMIARFADQSIGAPGLWTLGDYAMSMRRPMMMSWSLRITKLSGLWDIEPRDILWILWYVQTDYEMQYQWLPMMDYKRGPRWPTNKVSPPDQSAAPVRAWPCSHVALWLGNEHNSQRYLKSKSWKLWDENQEVSRR